MTYRDIKHKCLYRLTLTLVYLFCEPLAAILKIEISDRKVVWDNYGYLIFNKLRYVAM